MVFSTLFVPVETFVVILGAHSADKEVNIVMLGG